MNDLSALAMAQQPDDQYPEADQALSDAEGASSSSGESQTDKLMRWCDPSSPINIAEELDQNTLTEIAMRSVEEYDIDEASRREWVEQARIAMDLAMQRIKPKTSPWPGASNVIFPLMTEAADQFAARAYPAIVDNNNVVKGVVYGDDGGTPATDPQSGQPVVDPQSGQPQWAIPPNAKHHRADAIGAHMSWQLLEEQEE